MTVRATPSFLQAGTHPAEETRLMLNALAGGSTGAFSQPLSGGSIATSDSGHGIINNGDLAVTQNGTPNMSVNVAAGSCLIRGMSAAYQGTYHLVNDSSINLAIATADATNPRRDLVIAVVRDSGYAGSSDDARIIVVTGTPAASPSDPSLTSYPNALVIARVAVAAGATTVTNANITDLRQYALTNGTLPAVTSTTIRDIRLSGTADGQGVYLNTNTTAEGPYWYNGTSWRLPWNMPWGFVGRDNGLGPGTATSGTTETVIYTGPSFTAVSNRAYRTHLSTVLTATAGDSYTLRVRLDSVSGAVIWGGNVVFGTGVGKVIISLMGSQTALSAGSHSYVFTAARTGGTGTASIGTLEYANMTVEDIGPSGAPA